MTGVPEKRCKNISQMRPKFAVFPKYFTQMRKIFLSYEQFVLASHCDVGSPAQMRIIFRKYDNIFDKSLK